jgi:hypothetical protein
MREQLQMVNRLIDEFSNNHKFFIVLPPFQSNKKIRKQYSSKGLEIIVANQNRFGNSYTFDFQEWDDLICKIEPDVYISTAFFGTSFKCKRIVVIHDLVPIVLRDKINLLKADFYSKVIEKSIHES